MSIHAPQTIQKSHPPNYFTSAISHHPQICTFHTGYKLRPGQLGKHTAFSSRHISGASLSCRKNSLKPAQWCQSIIPSARLSIFRGAAKRASRNADVYGRERERGVVIKGIFYGQEGDIYTAVGRRRRDDDRAGPFPE